MISEERKQEFIAVLKHFDMFEPLSSYKVVCPFHGDKNPSLLIDLDNAKYYCFGCGIYGGAYDLIKQFYPSYNSFEIVRCAKRIVGNKEAKTKTRIVQVEEKKLNMQAVRDYFFNLPKTNWYKTDDPVKLYMKQRGFKMSTLNMSGARINATDDYKIVFPIMDNGAFRGYVGRTTDKEIEKNRKYIYNTGFRRSKTLAGIYIGSSVLVVEGFLDMLKARQNGVKSVVAILGWKMSEKQKQKLLHRGIKTIVCGLDNDQAGEKGYKYLKSLVEFDVVRLKYPDGVKDFGDVNQKIFQKYIKEQIKKYNLLEE